MNSHRRVPEYAEKGNIKRTKDHLGNSRRKDEIMKMKSTVLFMSSRSFFLSSKEDLLLFSASSAPLR
jgi:hypothetical protein